MNHNEKQKHPPTIPAANSTQHLLLAVSARVHPRGDPAPEPRWASGSGLDSVCNFGRVPLPSRPASDLGRQNRWGRSACPPPHPAPPPGLSPGRRASRPPVRQWTGGDRHSVPRRGLVIKCDRKVRPLPRRRGGPPAAHGLAFGPPKSRPGRGQPGGPSGPDARARGGGGGEEAAPRAAARPRPSRVHAEARRGWASARGALTGAGAASAMAACVPRSAALLPGAGAARRRRRSGAAQPRSSCRGGRELRPSHVPRRPFKQELRSRPGQRPRAAPPAARRTALPRPSVFTSPGRPRGSRRASGEPAARPRLGRESGRRGRTRRGAHRPGFRRAKPTLAPGAGGVLGGVAAGIQPVS